MKRIFKTMLMAVLMMTMCLCSTSCYMTHKADDIRKSVVMIATDTGRGTGFAIGEPGKPIEYIVTNAHVVSDTAGAAYLSATVYFSAATSDVMNARVYAVYPEIDVAILKLPEPTTKKEAALLCPSNEVDMTDTVTAFGFPGYANTGSVYITYDENDIVKTEGVISRFSVMQHHGVPVDTYLTDVKIGPGNSGGPLVNSKGQVIAINSFLYYSNLSNVDIIVSNYSIAIDELIHAVNRDEIPFVLVSEYNSRVIIIAGLSAAIAVVVIVLIILLVATKRKNNTDKKTDKNGLKVVLNGTAGVYAGRSFDVSSSVIFGRDSAVCQIVYPNNQPGISSCHCEVAFKNNEVTLTDLNSSYGTFLASGIKLAPNTPVVLKNGDVFYLAEREQSFMVVME